VHLRRRPTASRRSLTHSAKQLGCLFRREQRAGRSSGYLCGNKCVPTEGRHDDKDARHPALLSYGARFGQRRARLRTELRPRRQLREVPLCEGVAPRKPVALARAPQHRNRAAASRPVPGRRLIGFDAVIRLPGRARERLARFHRASRTSGASVLDAEPAQKGSGFDRTELACTLVPDTRQPCIPLHPLYAQARELVRVVRPSQQEGGTGHASICSA